MLDTIINMTIIDKIFFGISCTIFILSVLREVKEYLMYRNNH